MAPSSAAGGAGTASRGGAGQVVIVGAGFAGLMAVRSLREAPVDVVVVDRANYHLVQPLLYQVTTAALQLTDIAYSSCRVHGGRGEYEGGVLEDRRPPGVRHGDDRRGRRRFDGSDSRQLLRHLNAREGFGEVGLAAEFAREHEHPAGVGNRGMVSGGRVLATATIVGFAVAPLGLVVGVSWWAPVAIAAATAFPVVQLTVWFHWWLPVGVAIDVVLIAGLACGSLPEWPALGG